MCASVFESINPKIDNLEYLSLLFGLLGFFHRIKQLYINCGENCGKKLHFLIPNISAHMHNENIKLIDHDSKIYRHVLKFKRIH